MVFSEFKAWLDGFSHSIDGAPTKRQWELIQDKLDKVKPDTVTSYQPYYIQQQSTWPKWYVASYKEGLNDASSSQQQHTHRYISGNADTSNATSSVRLFGG